MLVVLALSALAAACSSSVEPGGGGGDPTPAASITLSTTTLNMALGDTVRIGSTVKDAAGNVLKKSINWTSSDQTVALVDTGGLVLSIKSGTATISAKVDQASASANVTVASGPELPRVLLNSAYPTPPQGSRTLVVAANGNLQAAIDSAVPGDVITLAKGATYTGTFILRNKNTTSTNWIIIRPDASVSLPAEGTRMNPTTAASLQLPKVLSPSSAPAFQTELSAHHYRLTGIEVSVDPSQTNNYGTITLGTDGPGGQFTQASIAHDFVLDRMYIHGSSTLTLRRCVAVNSGSTAIVDSYLSDCHDPGQDAQAIGGWNGPGPFKFVNNYLEASGEVILFGGSDPGVPNLVPADMEIRHNHLTRPTSWKGVWLIKNLFELKNAQRVLVDGNVFENTWQAAQDGTAIVMKSVNQQGSCSWCGTTDITFRRNIIRNIGAGFSIAASPDNNNPDIPLRRVLISDNLVYNMNVPGSFDGTGRAVLTQANILDVTLSHNTILGATNSGFAMGPAGTATQQFVVKDNIIGGGNYGIIGDNVGPGNPTWNLYAPDGVFSKNVMVLVDPSNFPAGNFYPNTYTAIGFTDIASSNYKLAAGSTYKGLASDGTDPGANIDLVLSSTQGVVQP